MIEFLVDNCPEARLVRRGGNFEIAEKGVNSMRLRKDISKKIWFALLTQSSALKFFHRNPQRRLHLGERKNGNVDVPSADFIAGSNCHGTVYQVMNPAVSSLSLNIKWSAIFSKISGQTQDIDQMELYLSDKKEENFPICIMDYGISHSAVIVGHDSTRNKYLIFEKVGYNYVFRLLFLDIKQIMEEGFTHFCTKVGTIIDIN